MPTETPAHWPTLVSGEVSVPLNLAISLGGKSIGYVRTKLGSLYLAVGNDELGAVRGTVELLAGTASMRTEIEIVARLSTGNSSYFVVNLPQFMCDESRSQSPIIGIFGEPRHGVVRELISWGGARVVWLDEGASPRTLSCGVVLRSPLGRENMERHSAPNWVIASDRPMQDLAGTVRIVPGRVGSILGAIFESLGRHLRGTPRAMTFIPALVESANGSHLAHVVDLSAGGARIATTWNPAVGTNCRITFDFDGTNVSVESLVRGSGGSGTQEVRLTFEERQRTVERVVRHLRRDGLKSALSILPPPRTFAPRLLARLRPVDGKRRDYARIECLSQAGATLVGFRGTIGVRYEVQISWRGDSAIATAQVTASGATGCEISFTQMATADALKLNALIGKIDGGRILRG